MAQLQLQCCSRLASGCEALGFSPALSASVVRAADGLPPNSSDFQLINLSASLTANPDQAGIKQASILLPKPITIDVTKLPTVICEEDQYKTNTCPLISMIGNAVATSPLLLPGETLSGPVYILRAVAPRVIPRLFVRLEGRINISLVATNTFENGTQVRAVFDDLPDAPLNTFSMNVNNFLSTMKAPCDLAAKSGNSMTGTLTGQNGVAAPVNSAFDFNCASSTARLKVSKFKGGKKPTFNLDLKARAPRNSRN